MALADIEKGLRPHSKSFRSLGLPEPCAEHASGAQANKMLVAELSHDRAELQRRVRLLC